MSLLAAPRTNDQKLGLEDAGSDFVLPDNIGDLNPAIISLNLRRCVLIGNDLIAAISQLVQMFVDLYTTFLIGIFDNGLINDPTAP